MFLSFVLCQVVIFGIHYLVNSYFPFDPFDVQESDA